jgi:hypothetical protein
MWGELPLPAFYPSYEDEGPLLTVVAGELTVVRMVHAPTGSTPSRWLIASGGMPNVRRREVLAGEA